MASEIRSAGKATEIATTFLKQYYGFLRPLSAERSNGNWVVKIDVGAILKEIAEITIDASSAEIISYKLPE